MDPILRRLDAIDDQLEVPSGHFRGELLDERDGLIDRLGEAFLAAGPRRRGAIRRFVAGNRRLVMAFEDRVAWHAFRIRTAEDVGHLRAGLAAAAIVGDGLDYRDLGFRIDHLARAAEGVGIDPRRHVPEVMDLLGRWKGRFPPAGPPGEAPGS